MIVKDHGRQRSLVYYTAIKKYGRQHSLVEILCSLKTTKAWKASVLYGHQRA